MGCNRQHISACNISFVVSGGMVLDFAFAFVPHEGLVLALHHLSPLYGMAYLYLYNFIVFLTLKKWCRPAAQGSGGRLHVCTGLNQLTPLIMMGGLRRRPCVFFLE
jgi:hypothetical protein